MDYVIGIDGGGTKTAGIALSGDGTVLGTFATGAANPHAVGFETAAGHAAGIIDYFSGLSSLKHARLRFVCLGLSGVDKPHERERFQAFLKEYAEGKGLDFGIYVTNDAEIALMSALGRNHGIIVISGTGSIVYGLTPEREHFRVGGWGHLLGDEGSGYTIGLQALKAVMRAHDGVSPSTQLTDLVKEKLTLASVTQLKEYIYAPSIKKQNIADFAMICIQAAGGGDPVSRHIVANAAADLAESAAAIRKRSPYFLQCPIAASGSVFKHSDLFRQTFEGRLQAEEGHNPIVFSEASPAEGAAKLALQMAE
jgi:N-acetylglucosamine kinase-like BadF-type ATPase